MDLSDNPARVVRDFQVGNLDEMSLNAGSIGEHTILHRSVKVALQRRSMHYYQHSPARQCGVRRMPTQADEGWPASMNSFGSSSAKHTGPAARQDLVYRNVCTSEDPPCSIAISSLRQCVAFGCRGGMELYWVRYRTECLNMTLKPVALTRMCCRSIRGRVKT